jgi:hypothetical protein
MLITFLLLTGCDEKTIITDTKPPTKYHQTNPNPRRYQYPWLKAGPFKTILQEIDVPAGYERIQTEQGTFADWLRHLPLKPGRPPVYLFNGKAKENQEAHAAVIDIDVGTKDLQQCADAVIRLRAEFCYSVRNFSSIHFNFTSGVRAEFNRWVEGYRPVVSGSKVSWKRKETVDDSYANFRQYLDCVFTYAGTLSLGRELKKVKVPEMQIGDVFIDGGSPGHAVIIIDMAIDSRSARKIFLLAQSYMPAQDIHILKNPAEPALGPWYPSDFGDKLVTPEWTFRSDHLKRF